MNNLRYNGYLRFQLTFRGSYSASSFPTSQVGSGHVQLNVAIWMYHDTTAAHLAVGHSVSSVLPSGIRFRTSSDIKAVQSAEDIFFAQHYYAERIRCRPTMTMRYADLRFIIIINILLLLLLIIIIIIQWRHLSQPLGGLTFPSSYSTTTSLGS